MLKLTRNSIHELPTDVFRGLENTLRELELSYLRLIQVPHASLYNLHRLQSLNLAGELSTEMQNLVPLHYYTVYVR